jgi:Family of unknown function (DUF6262)
MPPDPAPLRAAAQRKRAEAMARAHHALRELDGQAQPITFQAVARRAHVSRQWLYQQSDLRNEIERLRALQVERPAAIPARERASDASLRQRIETLRDEIQRLRRENHELRAELELAYGHQRETARGSPTPARPPDVGSPPS